MRKIWRLLVAVFVFVRCKLMYRANIKMHLINSIRGRFAVEIGKGGKIEIGKFLMTRGPFYAKCTEKALLIIGSSTFFNHNCSITCAEKIIIGNSCKFANNLVIVDHNHQVQDRRIAPELVTAPIVIEDNVWCGANVTILKGVHIGEGAIIAAGAVVVEDVPAHEVWGGVPAKQIKSL